MTMRIAPVRRFVIAALACALAGWMCRSHLATAMVLRGDEFLYRNRLTDAARYYGRALSLDPRFGVAADRYAFVALQSHNRHRLDLSVELLDRAIASDPGNPELRADRALCFHLERQYARALRDFTIAGAAARDARYFTFAGWDAYALSERHDARVLWRAALEINPHFFPARRALQRSR